MPDRREDSLYALVVAALREAAELVRAEFALFRAETVQNATRVAGGVGMFAVAGVFGVASLIWLTQALVYGLELVVHSRWLSALIVGAALALIAIALVATGRSRISAATLAPTRTVRSIQRDGEMLTDRVSK